MGIYENQLNQIANAPEWRVEHLDGLKATMTQLDSDMVDIAKAPGWTGVSAEAARTKFLELQEKYEGIATQLEQARSVIDQANDAKRRAKSKRSTLPDATVPDWLHTAALVGGSILIPVPGIGTFAAETVVQKVNQFLGAQREAAAHQILTELAGELTAPSATLKNNSHDGWPTGSPSPDFPGPPVVWHGDDTGAGGWSTGGSHGGSGTGGHVTLDRPPQVSSPPPYPPVVLPPKQPPGWPETSISLDGGTTGTTGGGLGGGAFGAGMLGVGGLAAASKLARGGLGSGGLLAGNGAGGVGIAGGMGGGAGGAAGSGAAGGRSNSAMMGGGAPGGGGSEKEKRHGLGLVAPKLEDDDETGPRAAAAGAGGRE